MDHMDPSAKSCTTRDNDVEILEPVELLDDYWFFQNLLQKKNGMFRSSSDPYPSSDSIEEVFAKIKNKESSESTSHPKENSLAHHNLHRITSLPLSIGRDKGMEEKEGLRRSSKLSRQSSLCSSNVLPPLHASKATTTTPGIWKRQVPRETIVESTIKDSIPRRYRTKGTMQRSLSHNKMSKSPSELEIEEVQGFKDIGFDFDKLELNTSVADIIPGLQSKKPDDWSEDKIRRPYLSEAWLAQTSTPVMPDWIDTESVGDMKKHLKYWARAVASNMRQEC